MSLQASSIRHWHCQGQRSRTTPCSPWVIMSSDLSLEKHVPVVSVACFSISGKFVVSGSHWMRSQQQHSSMHLWLLALTTVTPYWPGRRSSQQTSCSVWWTLLPASLATLGSSIAACRGYCTTNSSGSMSPTEYNSSSPCWCIPMSSWNSSAVRDGKLHINSRRRTCSYLCDRTFRVIYNGSTSCISQVTCSVPQGSVLDPRLFIMYTADPEEKVDEHGVNYHRWTLAMLLVC